MLLGTACSFSESEKKESIAQRREGRKKREKSRESREIDAAPGARTSKPEGVSWGSPKMRLR